MRHPQTIGNLNNEFVGQRNSPLSEQGEIQCKEAVDALIAWKPKCIVSSPLERCLSIAKPVADKLSLEVLVDEDFIEMSFGAAEGLTFDEAIAQGYEYPWNHEADYVPIAGADSLQDVINRCSCAFNEYAKIEEGRTAIICHGGVIKAILSYVLNLQPAYTFRLLTNNVSSCIIQVHNGTPFIESLFLTPADLKIHSKQN